MSGAIEKTEITHERKAGRLWMTLRSDGEGNTLGCSISRSGDQRDDTAGSMVINADETMELLAFLKRWAQWPEERRIAGPDGE